MTDPGLMPDSPMAFDPPQQQPKQKVPGLGFGGLGLGGGANKGGGFALNLAGLKPDDGPQQEQDFQDEFLLRIDEFSESWRQALRKEKRF